MILPFGYQADKHKTVLNLVKQYPFESLNKLAARLPQFSRRFIQGILEKHQLSTIEQRVKFASEHKTWFQDLVCRLRRFHLPRPRLKPARWSLRALILAVMGGALILGVSWLGYRFAWKTPTISLTQPEVGFVNQGETIYVTGKVVPESSRVTVNGEAVALNGDGVFTALQAIPKGGSALIIEAHTFLKKARLVRPVIRELTQEEEEAEAQILAQQQRQAADEAAALDRKVNDLLAAKLVNKESPLRILNNGIKEEAGFHSVVGEVVNLGSTPASNVMVTAKFYGETNNLLDTKIGFATDFKEPLVPGKTAKFQTQATRGTFAYYRLELEWETSDGAVAGSSTVAKEASLSATKNQTPASRAVE